MLETNLSKVRNGPNLLPLRSLTISIKNQSTFSKQNNYGTTSVVPQRRPRRTTQQIQGEMSTTRNQTSWKIVAPPKPIIMAAPAQPRKQSLAASYPMINVAARNAAMAAQRQQMLQRVYQEQHGVPLHPANTDAFENAMRQAKERTLNTQRQMTASKPSAYQNSFAAQERQATYSNQTQMTMQQRRTSQNISGIGIDAAAVERQRQFQQDAAQQSRSISQSGIDAQSSMRQHHAPLPNYHVMDAANAVVASGVKNSAQCTIH